MSKIVPFDFDGHPVTVIADEAGEALINLWMAVTGKLREDLPRRLAMPLSAARAGR